MSRFLITNRNIELLEPYEGKLSRTVLRGGRGSNASDLPDIQKQGDFFVESPIILLAAIIWYLRIYKDGKYCTFPHTIEFLNKPYAYSALAIIPTARISTLRHSDYTTAVS